MRPAPVLWTWLGRSLAVGATYDLLFALSILAVPGPSSAVLRIPLPEDPVYFRLVGVLLLMMAGFYAAAARDPRAYAPVAAVAAGGRFLGFLAMALAWISGAPAAFLLLAYGDLAFAAVHAFLLLEAREAEAREALPKKRRGRAAP